MTDVALSFRGQKQPSGAPVGAVQTGWQTSHPFSQLDRYVPLARQEHRLYDALREAVPVIDTAIYKILRLVGDFSVDCGSKALNRDLDEFLQNVPVGAAGQGISVFVSQFLEQLLMYGTAVGEMVPGRSGTGISALYVAPLSGVELRQDGGPLKVTVCRREGASAVPVKYPQLILLSALNPTPEHPFGVSMLRGLPFVSGILLKIFHSVGQNFERVGNIRFAVTYKPQEDAASKAFAKERAMQIASEWSRAMNGDGGRVSDFIAVGDVDIKVIGADNQILESSVPARQMLEQIIAKTGLPPFLLGLSWSSTERMAQQQSDLLTSELESYRKLLTPVIAKICRMWLRLHGSFAAPEIIWSDISLQDEVELAKARLMRAQAAQIEEKLGSRSSGGPQLPRKDGTTNE